MYFIPTVHGLRPFNLESSGSASNLLQLNPNANQFLNLNKILRERNNMRDSKGGSGGAGVKGHQAKFGEYLRKGGDARGLDRGAEGKACLTPKEEPPPTFSLPGLGKVGPISHDDSTEHNIIFGEVAGEEVCGAYHRDAKNIRYFIPMSCI